MLEAVYGKDKVKVNINTDLDFDAVKTNSVTYDPKNVVVSEHSIKEKIRIMQVEIIQMVV